LAVVRPPSGRRRWTRSLGGGQWQRPHRTTMRSSGNGVGPAAWEVTGREHRLGQINASLEIGAPAPIEGYRADALLRGEGPVAALGYMSAEGTARIDDPELRDQTAAIGDFCARQGWELVALLREIRPTTGRALDRPALSCAIERLVRGDASALVVTELARLCRSVAELGEILDALRRADARLVSLEPKIDTGTEFGRAAARMLEAVSEWERARLAERTRKGLAAARAQRRSAIEPELKGRIVGMRAAGFTLQAIADKLNEEGISTARGGAKWRPSSVQSALGYKRPTRRRPRTARETRRVSGGGGP
jgi:DNA invertase Pin-like site-specific DNA recombinase